jgi:CheY-like chemotaxis protein
MTLVLIVDDAAFSRRMLRKYIEAEGCVVLEANNGQEAMERILQHQPDCIFSDLLMPEINGFQLLQMIKDKGLTIPVVIISADIQDTSRQQCQELGAAGFVSKPIKEADIRHLMRQMIQQGGEDL